jgi:hypothetical protein
MKLTPRMTVMNVVKFPYSVSRRVHARRQRRSPNGTPEERAALQEIVAEETDARPPARSLSITGENERSRQERGEVWRMAEAATRYWKLRLDFQFAVSYAQQVGIPEGRDHPADPEDRGRRPMVEKYRAALVRQLLTPAPNVAAVAWKRAKLSGSDFPDLPVKPERVERVIADDVAFLDAHPTRRSNSEALAHRREFKEAMRQRIREIAASHDLSDEEIRPVLKLKYQEIANFTEKHGVNLAWLLEGKGQIFESGPTS